MSLTHRETRSLSLFLFSRALSTKSLPPFDEKRGERERERDVTAANDDLRLWRGVGRALDAGFRSAVEDPRDSVRLGQDGTVAETEGEAEADAQNAASEHVGFGQDRDGHQVAHEDARQQQVAQLPSRGHYHRRAGLCKKRNRFYYLKKEKLKEREKAEPVVAQEDCEGEQSGRDAHSCKHKRNDSPGAVPGQMFRRNLVAAVVFRIGRVAGSAGDASVVERVTVLATRHATPATLILFFLCLKRTNKYKTKRQKLSIFPPQ